MWLSIKWLTGCSFTSCCPALDTKEVAVKHQGHQRDWARLIRLALHRALLPVPDLKKKKLDKIACLYLSRTGLLYLGMRLTTGEEGQTCHRRTLKQNTHSQPPGTSGVNLLTSRPQTRVLIQRPSAEINSRHQLLQETGFLDPPVHGSTASYNTVTPPNIIHWQRVMAIKRSFISSPATTKVQNRIKLRCGTLPLLMLQPFENLLAMSGATMLQGRITEQRDGGIRNEVWGAPTPPLLHFYLHILKCFPYHQIQSLTRLHLSRRWRCCWRPDESDVVERWAETDVHSSKRKSSNPGCEDEGR